MASSSTCAPFNTRATAAASVVLPDPEHPTMTTRRMSALLLRRPNQDFVDRDAARLGDGVANALRNVLCVHDLDAAEGLGHALEDLRAVVGSQLRRGRSR